MRLGISFSAENDHGSAFGFRKPFEKGLTENLCAFASTELFFI